MVLIHNVNLICLKTFHRLKEVLFFLWWLHDSRCSCPTDLILRPIHTSILLFHTTSELYGVVIRHAPQSRGPYCTAACSKMSNRPYSVWILVVTELLSARSMASLGEGICNMPLYRDTIGQHMNASASFYRRDLMYMRPEFVSLDASVKATRDVNPLTYQTLLLLVVFVLYFVSIPSVSIHLY